jgi:uncharacterized protein
MNNKNEYIVMAKPVGSRCNMACRYCYYLGKGRYSMHEKQTVMSRPVLEKMIRQLIKSSPGPAVSIVWHGGEPTLAGLDFYKEAMSIERKYLPRGWQIWNNLQTNAVLIDGAWCDFLRENHWDVGVSIDGTRAAHDANRLVPGKMKPDPKRREGKTGKCPDEMRLQSGINRQTCESTDDAEPVSAWDRSAKSIRMLKDAGVAVDLLCTVNSETAKDPEGVYDALKSFDTGWMQFIPIVVYRHGSAVGFEENASGIGADDPDGMTGGSAAAGRTMAGLPQISPESVAPGQYGEFLCRVFDRWRSCGDVGKVHVQLFDETARAWKGYKPNLCWMQETCGRALIVEEDGAVYSCDHFVDPEHRLGNIREQDLGEMADCPEQAAFGLHKRDALCDECRSCRWISVCGGGCPKDWVSADGGRPKYFLCEGLKSFWEHAYTAVSK